MSGPDRVVLITGATGSLGRVAVRSFAADGWRVGVGGTNADRLRVPGMIERGWGRIVAVTTSLTATTPARTSIYSTTKVAQETLLRVLAKEVAGTGVTVNIVAIRAVDAEHVRDREPSPRTVNWSTPEEIAATFRFLCSEDAATINGARIALEGRG